MPRLSRFTATASLASAARSLHFTRKIAPSAPALGGTPVALVRPQEEGIMRGLLAHRWTVLCGILLALPLAVSIASAQDTTTGSIAGRIVDTQHLPVPGATVTVVSPQGPKTFTTDSDGRFFAAFLTPGSYDIKADLSGFRPVEQHAINVRLGQRIDLELTLQVGEVSDTVVVSEQTPVVDMTKTVVSTTLDSALLTGLPVGRRFSDALYLAPGVSSGGQVGMANPSIGGGSGLENNYIIDGVNVTNAGYGALGSYSIVFGSLGNGVPFDFIKEAQVQTSGFSAEYGQSSGGVVNVITRSGSNQLRGGLFAYSRPTDAESTYNLVETVNGTVNTTHTNNSDAGIQIGGPAIKDKLFFFAAVDPQWQQTQFVAPNGFPLASLGDVAQDRRIVSYAAKATYQITSGQHLDASFFGDPARGLNGPQRYTALLGNDTSAFSSLDYGGHNQTVKYEGALASGWLLEGSFARAQNSIVETPSVNTYQVLDTTVTPEARSGGIGFYEVGNDGVNWQYQAKATKIIGGHQIRFGTEFENISYDNTINYTGPTFTLPNGQQTVTGASIQIQSDPTYGLIYRVSRANTSNVRATTSRYADVFAQDTWKVGDKLTITPGVRWERQSLTGLLESVAFTNNWAPRIGATYDPTGLGKMKIYANWGLFYSKMPNDLAARALSADAGVSRADYFDAALTQPVPDGTLALGTTTHYIALGQTADDIDPNIKAGYLNEVLAGFEYEAAPGLNLGVRYIHRDIPRIVEDVQPFPMVATELGIPGAATASYLLTNPSASTATAGDLGASFEDPVHKYDAIEFVADKRLSNNWTMQVSYRYSRLRGTFEGFFRDDNGQSDPGITSLDDFPTNDPSYTAIGVPQFGYSGDIRYLGALGQGPLPLDRPHQVKIFGTYAFKYGLNVGANISLSSGKPLTEFAASPAYDSPGEIPTTPRGDGFQTVDGFMTRSPFDAITSVHGDWGLHLRGSTRVVLSADIFNLFNQQTVLDYDPDLETTFGAINPDLGQASRLSLAQLQTPRQIRFGVRYEF
jgi:outer membrane receptor protein involved in Fe transport